MDNPKTLVIIGAGKTIVTEGILEDFLANNPGLTVTTVNAADCDGAITTTDAAAVRGIAQQLPSLIEPRPFIPDRGKRAQWKDETNWRGRRR